MTQRLQALGHTLIGCDIYDRSLNASAMEMDEFFQSILATDEAAYTRQMLDAVRTYRLDYLIPLTDLEIDVLAPLKAEFLALGCVLCAPDASVSRLLRAKDDMNLFLHSKAQPR